MRSFRRLVVGVPVVAMSFAIACGDGEGAGTASPPSEAGPTSDAGTVVVTEDDAGEADARALVQSVVAVGGTFACVLTKDRTVACWGKNDLGQLGREPTTTPSCGAFPCAATPSPVEGLSNIERLVAGDDFACALDSRAQVWCWGSNAKGQLGTSGIASASTPRLTIVKVTAISAAGSHACAITTDGLLFCWGENNCDTLGKGAGAVKWVPGQTPGVPLVAQVSVGPDAVCAVKPDGRILCWGADHRGSLGHDLESNPPKCAGFPYDSVAKHVQSKATEIPLDRVRDVHLGTGVACARQVDGTVLCWGDNERGALGQGIAEPSAHPRALEVPALKAVKLDVHGQTACVVVAERLFCWGDGSTSKLPPNGADAGCTGCRPLAYAIPGMNGVRDVFGGPGALASIKSDLSLWMWGRNDTAQLASSPSAPVQLPKQLTGAPPID